MINVLHVSAECSPFVKVGGLADVIGSLPNEIKRLKNSDVRVVLPFYKSIPKKYQDKAEDLFNFNIDFDEGYVGVKTLKKGNILYYFIDSQYYFGSRDNIYNYGDEGKRYTYFQLAVLGMIERLDFLVNIIHVHDWHTAMIPLIIKKKYQDMKIKSVLSLHNLQYQGIFPLQDFQLFGINYDTRFEYDGHLNFLKAGIVSADIITTVSPNYAQEILTDYYGYGMQNLLKMRGSDVIGILNGIDYKEFSPEKDSFIQKKFSIDNYKEGKLENKKYLFKELKIDFDIDKPLISIISRLVNQKGIDLVQRVFEEMLGIDNFNFIILGSGEDIYEEYFKDLEIKFPNKVKSYIGYSNKLAHMIYASSDIFLMPSKFEPCGLGQIIALKYGTIPVVRETGGLVDTIEAYNEYEKKGNGFSFTNFIAHDMMHTIRYALQIYHNHPSDWDSLVKNAMSSDFSWNKSAKKYKEIYQELKQK